MQCRWQVIDYSGHELVSLSDEEDAMIGENGEPIEGIVRYVLVHPADIAALPSPRLRRNCWRRRP